LPVHLNKFVRLDRLETRAARLDPKGIGVDMSTGIPFADNDILTRLIAQYDPRGRTWARPLLAEMGIPHRFLPDIVPPATDLGPLLPPLAHLPGLEGTYVIATACHDTQAAITAVPARDPDYAYISSGSWSLMGVEVREPIIDDGTLRHNFTNEGGVGGFCLLKNLTGLWLVQECRRAWSRPGQEVSYANLMTLAAKASSFGALIDPDSPLFLNPDDMPAAIAQFCAQTGQTPPATPGATIRGALEGLALRYRHTLDQLESILGKRIATIHIVGGGAANTLLCQMAADACARPVLAGPVEATALGNILLQMLAQGQVQSVEEARELGRESFPLTHYEPRDSAPWDEAFGRFSRLLSANGA
jgi:rhamnulokinase